MAIMLPDDVASFLNDIGVPWINVNEDEVRAFAVQVRSFAAGLKTAREHGASTIQQLGTAYQGSAYEALFALWTVKSAAHLDEVAEGCGLLAGALDAAAEVIELDKRAALFELGLLMAALASSLIDGTVEFTLPAVTTAARELLERKAEDILVHIETNLLAAALYPLVAAMDRAVLGLALNAEAAALNEPISALGPGFAADPHYLNDQGAVMREQSKQLAGKVLDFAGRLEELVFE